MKFLSESIIRYPYYSIPDHRTVIDDYNSEVCTSQHHELQNLYTYHCHAHECVQE